MSLPERPEKGEPSREQRKKSYLRSASVSGPCTHWHNQGRQRTLLKGKRENKNWKTEPYTLIHSYAQHFNIFKALLHPFVHLTPKQSHEWTGHVLFIPFYEWGRKLRHRQRSHMEVTESELKPCLKILSPMWLLPLPRKVTEHPGSVLASPLTRSVICGELLNLSLPPYSRLYNGARL